MQRVFWVGAGLGTVLHSQISQPSLNALAYTANFSTLLLSPLPECAAGLYTLYTANFSSLLFSSLPECAAGNQSLCLSAPLLLCVNKKALRYCGGLWL
jgi:hypothetical protein